MSQDDDRYFERRAEQEIEAAQNASDPRIVEVHYRMATEYLERLYPDEDDQ